MNASTAHAVSSRIQRDDEKARPATGPHAPVPSPQGDPREVSPATGESAAADPLFREMAQDWLDWQCQMIAGVVGGALFPADGSADIPPLARWPEGVDGPASLRETALQALTATGGTLTRRVPGNTDTGPADVVACRVMVEGRPVAVVAVAMTPRSDPQQRAVLQLLQWGALWMQTMVRRQGVARRDRQSTILAVVSASLAQATLRAAASGVVDELADRLECERVSIGIRRGLQFKLVAMSHTRRFDPRTRLVGAIEAAMEEAADQGSTLIHPVPPDRRGSLTRAHGELAARGHDSSVCSVPLPGTAGAVGVLTAERAGGEAFKPETVALCEAVASLVGPVLELRRAQERGLLATAVSIWRERAVAVFGPRNLKLKAAALSAAVLFAVLLVAEGDHRVTARSTIEGAVQRAVVAPQQGYVADADVRAGDMVSAGDVMATLDDGDLRLELQKWESERDKHLEEYHEALATRDRTRLSVLRARIDQAEAELRLLDDRLERSRLRAPFDGIVVSGDLSQSLGAPVETGQVLFEVAPLDSYRVVLEVDEHDVAALSPGQRGHVVIAALPHEPLGIRVQKVTPVAVSEDGRNFFRVEGLLESSPDALRPGMEGVSKVVAGRRSLLWIWTHAVVDRLRLWAWSLGL